MPKQYQQDDQSQKTNRGRQPETPSNRRSFLRQGSLATSAAAIFSFFGMTPFLQANASSDIKSPGRVELVPLNIQTAKAQLYRDAVLKCEDYQQFQQILKQEAESFNAQEDAATVTQISIEGQQIISVQIPLKDDTGYSFYSALLRPESATVIQSHNALVHFVDRHTTAVVIRKNGQIIFDGFVALDGTIIHGAVQDVDGNSIVLQNTTPIQAASQVVPLDLGGWWNCFNNCCSSAGVPGVVLGLIGLSCVTACGATFGIACGLCITAISAGYGSIIGYCLAACS